MLDLKFVKNPKENESFFIAGCDEVGRGPLAGPVVAACVCYFSKTFREENILSELKKLKKIGVSDSKKLSKLKRKLVISKIPGLSDYLEKRINQFHHNHFFSLSISEYDFLLISISEIQVVEIDKINILNASLLAMRNAAFEICTNKEGVILIDGNKKFNEISDKILLNTIVKGDLKSVLIGLSSIVAKEYRDGLMNKLDLNYPQYCWSENSGYPTKKHLEAIKLFGVTEHHRKSFRGVKEFCE